MNLKKLIYFSFFFILAVSCNESVIEPEQTTQAQLQTNELKAAVIGNLFVSPTGSDSNTGSESKPFRTLGQAASVAQPGDVVVFENGIYPGTRGNFMASLSRSGTSSAYITFKARNKGGAILDGQNNAAIAAFSISSSYINISGFEIKGMENVGIEVRDGVSHINFSDLNIHDIGRRITQIGDGSGITIGKSNYMVIERCLFHDLGAYAPGENGATYPAGYTGYQTLYHGIYIDGTSYVTVKNNVFYNITGGFGVQIYSREGNPSSYVDIVNNTFENGNPYQAAGHIILCNDLSNALIANNIFKDHYSYAINMLDFGYTYSSITIAKNITSGGNGSVHGGSAEGTTVSNNSNSTDPLFSNEASHDYTLKSNSPANGAGYNTGVTTDYLNNSRASVNIGAYGSLSSASTPTPPASTPTPTPTPTPVVTPTPTPTTPPVTGSVTYYNTRITTTATKSGCGAGYVGSKINYVVAANTFTSKVSQNDANAKATAYGDARKQRNADTNGRCIPIGQ